MTSLLQALLDSTKQSAEREILQQGGVVGLDVHSLAVEGERIPRVKDAEREVGGRRSSRRESMEEESRQRRRLVGDERRAYHHGMRKAEVLLEDGHAYRARDSAKSALEHYRREERLEGFEGQAARGTSEAWRLLHRTIKVIPALE